MGGFVERFFRLPLLHVLWIAALTVVLAMQLPRITINNNIEIFVPEEHPSRVACRRAEEIYGSQNLMSVALETRDGSVLTPKIVSLIRDLTAALETLEGVEDVLSPTNAEHIGGDAEGMRVEELAAGFDGSAASLAAMRARVLSWPEMYRGTLFAEDLGSAQILVRLVAGADTDTREAVYRAVRARLSETAGSGYRVHVAGDPVVVVLIKESMLGDLAALIPLVALVVVLVLFVSFRSLAGVLLPTATVLVSTTWAVGLMPLLGIYFSMISTAIPVVLIAVGSAYGIHLVNQVRVLRGEREGRAAVLGAVRTVGRPVALSALTTAVGFASVGLSPIKPLQHFGLVTAVGVMAALVAALTLIPSLLLLRPSRTAARPERSFSEKTAPLDRGLGRLHRTLARRPGAVLTAAGLIAVASGFAATRVVVDNSMLAYFPRSSEIRRADRFVNSEFAGSKLLSVLVEGREAGDLTDPRVLLAMEDLARHLRRARPEVGNVLGFQDFVARMNKVMHYPAETEGDGNTGESASTTAEDAAGAGEEALGFSSFFEAEEPETAETRPDAPERTPALPTGPSLPAGLDARAFTELLHEAYLRADSFDISARELLDLLAKETNYRGEAYNEIPADPARYGHSDNQDLKDLVSQYLLLYSGSLDQFVDDSLEPSAARMTVQLRATNTRAAARVVADIRDFTAERFPDGIRVSVAGYPDMELAVTRLIVRSQIASLVTALVLVFVIVSVSHRSPVAGLFALIPLSLASLVNFGLMGAAGIRLDIATAMIASVAIGIGVDYTIHFLDRYVRLTRSSSPSAASQEATRGTLLTTGKAILFNAVSVGAGFAVLAASSFNPLRYVGLLVAVTMATASLAALTVLPLLLNHLRPSFLTTKEDSP